ncbi:MAG: FAD-dependent oxidoreductase [Planctomycetaceae bacterium]
MSKIRKVAVAGGGIIGIATAYFLRRAGLDVVLFDQAKLGAGCSHGNCGYISPSHIFPLCTPQALKLGMTAMWQSNGPLRIRPGLNLSLWKWLFQFAGHCNQRDMLAIGHARHAILDSARELYQQIIEEHALDCNFQAKGCLFVYADEAAFVEQAVQIDLMRKEYGVEFSSLVGPELESFEPALIPGSAYGAYFYPQDAHVRPDRLINSWVRVLRELGVEIREDCRFEHFLAEGNTVRGLQTSQGVLDADTVVVAMGALTPFLNQQLGFQVPIQPGKGYSITMSCPAICPERPMIFEQDKVAVTPMQSAWRIGSTMELAGYNSTLNRSRLELLRRGATRYLREPFGPTVEEEWFGWRPMTPDGKAIIDFSPRYQNVMIAAGHNMLGLSMAPATGKLVSELLTGSTPHIDPTPFQYPRKQRAARKQSRN